jgi:hypothetical protein
MSQVKVMVKTTINLGNFENVVIEIQVEDASLPNEKTSATVDRIYELVATKVAEKAARFTSVSS